MMIGPTQRSGREDRQDEGRQHALGDKAEHAGTWTPVRIVAVTLQGADQGDTTTLWNTVEESVENLRTVADAPQGAPMPSREI